MLADILILYGTTDGHTKKIAFSVAASLRARGLSAEVVDVKKAEELSPEEFRGIVIAASLHGGKYQSQVRRWVTDHSTALKELPTGFISVCLGVLEKSPRSDIELSRIMEDFFVQLSWMPMVRKIVAGALIYTQYGWIKKWIMKRIASQAGGSTDTSKDYVYTDWKDLDRWVGNLVVFFQQEWTIQKPISKWADLSQSKVH